MTIEQNNIKTLQIQYTLFLKEVGMSVYDASVFWRSEYTQASGPGTCCQHDWARDEKRYTYSIRHLYGLEGARVNYRGHSCQTLQVCFVV